jgi:hypothetical protein
MLSGFRPRWLLLGTLAAVVAGILLAVIVFDTLARG